MHPRSLFFSVIFIQRLRKFTGDRTDFPGNDAIAQLCGSVKTRRADSADFVGSEADTDIISDAQSVVPAFCQNPSAIRDCDYGSDRMSGVLCAVTAALRDITIRNIHIFLIVLLCQAALSAFVTVAGRLPVMIDIAILTFREMRI